MPAPPPIIPKTSKKLKLLDIDPTELARQLTVMEANLYKKIRPIECLQRSRETKPGKNQDNITAIIQLSNRVSILLFLFNLRSSNYIVACQLGRGDYPRT